MCACRCRRIAAAGLGTLLQGKFVIVRCWGRLSGRWVAFGLSKTCSFGKGWFLCKKTWHVNPEGSGDLRHAFNFQGWVGGWSRSCGFGAGMWLVVGMWGLLKKIIRKSPIFYESNKPLWPCHINQPVFPEKNKKKTKQVFLWLVHVSRGSVYKN